MTGAQAPQFAFDVLAEIAAGATARIELCRIRQPEERSGQLVALKRLHRHIAEDPQFADMFFDEVWMTAALHHPNVVDVVGWGADAEGTYLAVELVQGVSLLRLMKTVFETGEMFSERMVVFLGCELCAGLVAAHDLLGRGGEHLGLVHRDLTPGNVLVGFSGQVKIADFGLAKAKQRVTKTLTGLLKGNPQYMAPEVARGLAIDKRADLFSLGVMLFELLSGKHPWAASTDLEVMRIMANQPPHDLAELRPRVDKELVYVVHRLLEKDPNARFQEAAEVHGRLRLWLENHGYNDGNDEALGRFVRRNAMRQMRWFERAVSGELKEEFPDSIRRPEESSTGGRLSRSTNGRGPQRPRRARRVPTDEITEVSNMEDQLLRDSDADPVDWGEEVPTVVQKKGQGDIPAIPGVPRVYSLADDDSGGQTTSVNKVGHMGVPRMPSDPESEEIPTVPVRNKAVARRIVEESRARGLPPTRPPPIRASLAVAPRAVPVVENEPIELDEATAKIDAERYREMAAQLQQEADALSELASRKLEWAARAQRAATYANEMLQSIALRQGARARARWADAQQIMETLAREGAVPMAHTQHTQPARREEPFAFAPSASFVPTLAGAAAIAPPTAQPTSPSTPPVAAPPRVVPSAPPSNPGVIGAVNQPPGFPPAPNHPSPGPNHPSQPPGFLPTLRQPSFHSTDDGDRLSLGISQAIELRPGWSQREIMGIPFSLLVAIAVALGLSIFLMVVMISC